MIRKLLTISFVILTGFANAQQTPDKILNDFFSRIEKDSIAEAIDYIFSINKLPSISQPQIESLKLQLASTHEALGELNGKELVLVRKLSNALIIQSYLMKYDTQPIRFNFIFYNPTDNGWRLQKFWYDDDLIDELSSATNINRHKILTDN